ncbi:hypothetical protein VII00023_04747 [Vibrio ichthyoenteri ATCC 700023]|uniref:Uncharacterized protein n=1 Tax=Vibrio ichthyoenteri ATCC 700023 TaxID=870968 RepID=F9S8M3_9VIBR|nr:hypothetical protein VII00023_04747 [Vibrio ichthyoenteri ATCC 700023]
MQSFALLIACKCDLDRHLIVPLIFAEEWVFFYTIVGRERDRNKVDIERLLQRGAVVSYENFESI